MPRPVATGVLYHPTDPPIRTSTTLTAALIDLIDINSYAIRY